MWPIEKLEASLYARSNISRTICTITRDCKHPRSIASPTRFRTETTTRYVFRHSVASKSRIHLERKAFTKPGTTFQHRRSTDEWTSHREPPAKSNEPIKRHARDSNCSMESRAELTRCAVRPAIGNWMRRGLGWDSNVTERIVGKPPLEPSERGVGTRGSK